MIDTTFEGFRYHKPLPNYYKVENPKNPKSEISEDLLNDFNELILKYNFSGLSYSKLSDDFKDEFGIDFDNVIIFKFLMRKNISIIYFLNYYMIILFLIMNNIK